MPLGISWYYEKMLTPPKGGLVLANVVPTQNVGVALND